MNMPKLSKRQEKRFIEEMNEQGFVILMKTKSGYRVLRDTRMAFINPAQEKLTMTHTDKKAYME